MVFRLNDERGILPRPCSCMDCLGSGLAYVKCVVTPGKPPVLIPFIWGGGHNGPSQVGSACQRLTTAGMKTILWRDKQIVTSPGLYVSVVSSCTGILARTEVAAYTGVQADMDESFLTPPSTYWSIAPEVLAAYQKSHPDECALQVTDANEVQFNLADHIAGIMGREFPKEGEVGFIPLPQRLIDQRAMDILMIENLIAESERGHAPSQLLEHIESETGQSVADVLRDARAEMSRMIDEANDEHVHITARAEHRNRLIQAERVSGAASSSSSSSEPRSDEPEVRRLSSASAPSIDQLTRPVDDPSAQRLAVTSSLSYSSSSSSSVSADLLRCVETALGSARLKYRHAVKVALSVVHSPALQLKSVSSSGGSHRVYHFDGGVAPLTIVRHHGCHDSLVTRHGRVSLFQPLMQALLAKLNA